MDELPELMDAGGVMVDRPGLLEHARRVAALVNQIIQGAKPADLPLTKLFDAAAPDQADSGGKFWG
jgi:hypothetical protein